MGGACNRSGVQHFFSEGPLTFSELTTFYQPREGLSLFRSLRHVLTLKPDSEKNKNCDDTG